MVVFTCTHCGESLQKPKVEKHYQTTCRNPISVSCMDCFKDFKRQEYVTHIKCVTEDERYSKKGTVSSVQKGALKQSAWVETVNSIIEQQTDATPSVKVLLDMMSQYTNVPRKKKPFINFIINSSGRKANQADIETIWDLLEKHKNAAKAEEKAKQGNTDSAKETDNSEKMKRKAETSDETETDETASKKTKKDKSGNIPEKMEISTNGIETTKSKKKKRKSKALEEPTTENTENTETVESPKKKKKNAKSSEEIKGDSTVAENKDSTTEVPRKNSSDFFLDEMKNAQNDDKIDDVGSEMKKSKKNKLKSKGNDSNGTTEHEIEKKDDKVEEKANSTLENVKTSKKKNKAQKNGLDGTLENGAENNHSQGNATTPKKKKNKGKQNGLNGTIETGTEHKDDVEKKEVATEAKVTPKKKNKGNKNAFNGMIKNGIENKNEVENGVETTDAIDKMSKKKKNKKGNGQNGTVENGSPKTSDNDQTFNWRDAILSTLNDELNGLSRETLRKRVFEKYEATKGKIESESKMANLYTKKFRKIKNIKLENDIVTLIET